MILNTLITTFLILTLQHNCVDKQTQQNSSILEETIQVEQIDTLIYEATTRGFYEKAIIVKDQVSYTMERGQEELVFQPLENEKWLKLLGEINEVGLKNIENFEAPTAMHQVDGAALAHIEIHSNEKVYRSQSFDKGHPPKELSGIYKSIQTIIESTDKQ